MPELEQFMNMTGLPPGWPYDDYDDNDWDRLLKCWRLQDCGDCLKDDADCAWCPFVCDFIDLLTNLTATITTKEVNSVWECCTWMSTPMIPSLHDLVQLCPERLWNAGCASIINLSSPKAQSSSLLLLN